MIVLRHAYMVVQFNRRVPCLASGGAAESGDEKARKDRVTGSLDSAHETGAMAYILI
jgi:hypothetical protein